MSPTSLSMKAHALGQDSDKLVQVWKKECESVVQKQTCFQLVEDHLQEVAYLPQLPCVGEVKEFLQELNPSTPSIPMEISKNSDHCSTLDFTGLNFCCNYKPKSVLYSTCSMLEEKGVTKDVVVQCLEDIVQLGCDETSMLEAVIDCGKSQNNYPSYQIIGDNVDLEVKVRHMDNNNKNKSFHWFNLVAFKDQATGSHLPDVHERTLGKKTIHVGLRLFQISKLSHGPFLGWVGR